MNVSVIMSVRGHQPWLTEAVESCRQAGLEDVRVYDDASSVPLACDAHLVRGKVRLGAAFARMVLLDELADSATTDDHVCVLLDGDDTLKNHAQILPLLRDTYDNPVVQMVGFSPTKDRAWLANTRYWTKSNAWNLLLPNLRTFRLGAYRRFRTLDPQQEFLKHDNGSFVTDGTDRSLLCPMLLLEGAAALRLVSADFHFYRLHNDMTHLYGDNHHNGPRFPKLVERFFPHLP